MNKVCEVGGPGAAAGSAQEYIMNFEEDEEADFDGVDQEQAMANSNGYYGKAMGVVGAENGAGSTSSTYEGIPSP